jgi:hypothetical protein
MRGGSGNWSRSRELSELYSKTRFIKTIQKEKMKALKIAALSALIAGASIGLAGPASADPLDGAYTMVVTDGHGSLNNGASDDVVASPCGPDCSHLNAPKWSADVHLAGNTWTGVASNGMTLSFDNNSLSGTTSKPGYATLDVQLRKV